VTVTVLAIEDSNLQQRKNR